jgi:serine protease
MDAVNRCKAGGANVINMSLVGIGFSRAENAAFTDLLSIDNILCVAAAGNFGNSKEGTDLQYPASYDSVVSVAAIDSNKVVAPFSQRNDQIDVAAPGVDVRSTARRGTGDFGGFLETRGGSYSGMPMLGSATGSASGVFVDCGIGDYDCTAASGQICLIQRDGVILFRDKVLACQNGGGLGAVISNNVAGNLVGDLGDADTQIPSIGISITDGEYLLANNLGNSITLTVGLSNYESLAGTSMATPHVSGVAALIWSQDPTKTAGEVRAALLNTAEDLGVPEKDNSYGYGLVQAAAACAALTGSSCAPPSSEPSSEPSAGPSLSSSPTGTSSPPSGPPSEEPSLAPSLSLELSARPSLSSSSPPSSSPTSTPVPSILDPRPFLAACSLDSDCLSNNCMDLVCRSSPTVKANKIKMSGNRGGTGGGGAKGEENRRHLWRRQTGPRGA